MTQALALGLGSMFNHSIKDQNVGWSRDLRSECIIYTSLKSIRCGEELCISYGSGHLWFEDADPSLSNSNEANSHDDIDIGQTLGELELSGLSSITLD